MQEYLASQLGYFLYLTSLDGYPPNAFLIATVANPTNPQELRSSSVEVIYRCLKCDLLALDPPWANKYDAESFAELLSEHDPYEDNPKKYDSTCWQGPLLCATKKTESLLTKYRINDSKNTTFSLFIKEILDIFNKQGLPWGKVFYPISNAAH